MLYQQASYTLGTFIGYHYWFTHYNGLGCTQTAQNPDVCSAFSFTNATDTLNDTAVWNALRLGVTSNLQLTEKLNFILDAAYIYAYLTGHDFHNLRPDIRGEFFEGAGNGFQFDMAFNWLFTSNLSMGIGARWWDLKTRGYSHFEETSVEGKPQYVDTKQNNYGLTIQSQYRFDESKRNLLLIYKDGTNNNTQHWQGFFFGANLGYGMYVDNASVSPFDTTPILIANVSPLLVHLQSAGFLGGGQMGYHWTKNNFLLGVEADIDYASVGGTNSISRIPTPYFVNNSVTQSLNWFGTARAKLGTIASNNMLPYLTAGLSVANTTLTYAQKASLFNQPFLEIENHNKQTLFNWVAGAGLEYAVSNHLHYKIEYLYLNIGELSLNSTYYAIKSDFANNILRLGINYYI